MLHPIHYNMVYRAVLPCGDIIESVHFENIYRAVLHDLRSEVGHLQEGMARPYKMFSAKIEFGVEVAEEIKPGYFHSEWHQLQLCGTMFVSDISIAYIRGCDGKQNINFRPWVVV